MTAWAEPDLAACFSPDYRSARAKFLAAAAARGCTNKAYVNSNRGPFGEELATDTAWFGPVDAANVLVLVSSTHGVEGFCGSGAQLDWLSTYPRDLPADTAVLLIHALNPHGFAWLRRTTEEGVDLNRNCVPLDQPLPPNEFYEQLADAFVPKSLDPETLRQADAQRSAFRAEHGDRVYENARSGGQYTHPDGIFYGGTAPTWSLQTMQNICTDFELGKRRGVAVIDYHTGLGPFGYGEPICGHRPGETGQAHCRKWYGESLGEPLLGKSSSLPIAGLTQYAWARAVGAEVLTFVALEFGTYPQETGASALRDDHWLHAYGTVNWQDEQTRQIKAALRRFYFPDTDDWKEMVLLRSRQVIRQALGGLNQPLSAAAAA